MGRRVRAFRVHQDRHKHSYGHIYTDSEEYNDAVFMLTFGAACAAIALLFAAAIVFPGTFIAAPVLWLATAAAIPASGLGAFLGVFAALFGFLALDTVALGATYLYELKDKKKVDEKKLDKEEQIEPEREQPEHTERDEVVTEKSPVENEHEAGSKKLEHKKQIENKYEQSEKDTLLQKNYQFMINNVRKAILQKLIRDEQIENKGHKLNKTKKTEVHVLNSEMKKRQLAIPNEICMTLEAKSKSEDLKSGSEKKVEPLKKASIIKAQQNHIGQKKNKIDKPPDFTP